MKNKIRGIITNPLYKGFVKMLSADEIKPKRKLIIKNSGLTYDNEVEKHKATLLRKNREQDLYNIIGKNLKRLRKIHKTTGRTVARLIGVSVQQLTKYENGTNKISISSLFIISKHFNVPVTWIL